MKYSSYIDNITAIEWGMDIKLAYLFDWIYTLPAWAECIHTEGGNFYFASKKKACEELPLLTDKIDTMYRYYKGLEELGLIVLIKVGNKDYIQLTSKAKIWGKSSEHSDKNPRKLGNSSESSSENNPTYKYTISDKNTSISSLGASAPPNKKFSLKKATPDEAKKWLFSECKNLLKKYTKELVREFYDYWIEPSTSGDKVRCQGEDFFAVPNRMATWKRKDDEKRRNFNGNKNQPVTPSVISKPSNLRHE